MNSALWETGDRLFVFGSLMDSDVLQLVTDMSIADLSIEKAAAMGYRQCEVSEESYPVLVVDDTSVCHGLLIGGLTPLALQRVLFFEGEEYALKPIRLLGGNRVSENLCGEPTAVDTVSDRSVNAYYFSDTGEYTVRAESWDYDNWQQHHKSSFVVASASYMRLFGQMTAAEADAHWLQPGSSPESTGVANSVVHGLSD